VVPQECERVGHVDVEAFGDDAFRLFDQDPAAQCGLQLLGERVAAMDGPLLQQTDGGHIGQCLTDAQLDRVQRAGSNIEKIQCADHLGA
jgi:hypothetical protein